MLQSQRLGVLIFAILLLSSIAEMCAAEAEFAAASIRPSDPNGSATRPRTGPMTFFRRATLKDLIALAYDIEKFQIVGGPNWLEQQRYDVEAKTETPASPAEMLGMLRSLLQSRFNLKTHIDSQPMTVFALIVERRRERLRDAAKETPRDGIGAIQVGASDVRGRGVTMRLLARYLAIELGRPVINETDLDGHYDFTVSFGDVKPPEDSPDSFGSLSFAIKDLGLKLQSKRAAVTVLTIDSAVPPTAN